MAFTNAAAVSNYACVHCAAQRKKVEGVTASHLMFGFAGAERNCNPWHVRGGSMQPMACAWG